MLSTRLVEKNKMPNSDYRMLLCVCVCVCVRRKEGQSMCVFAGRHADCLWGRRKALVAVGLLGREVKGGNGKPDTGGR